MKFQKTFSSTTALLIAVMSFIYVGCSKTDLTDQNDVEGLQVFDISPIEGQYIVELYDTEESKSYKVAPVYGQIIAQTEAYILRTFENIGLSKEQLQYVYGGTIVGFCAQLDSEQLAYLEKSSLVKNVEQDQMIILKKPKNPGGGNGGGGGSTDPAQTTPWGITRVGGSGDGTGKRAWIIDSGVDMDHKDLNVDAANSISFLTGSPSNRTPEDGHGHGTHVAGTVAAKDNSIGVVGVAANASVVAVRVLDKRGSGSTSGVIKGVDYVGTNGSSGEVANMSLGGGVSSTLDNAVKSAASGGVKFVLAAGNDSDNANNHSPARANGTNIYTISASDANDRFASFSNYGNPPIEVAAPGVSINSTWKGGSYRSISGTSMAAPHVTGILLLGSLKTDGVVSNDRDSQADSIAHR